MPTLYRNGVSGNCYKIELLAAHLGLELDLSEVHFHGPSAEDDRAAVQSKSTIGRVPTLVLDDGRVLSESGAILWYLAEGTRFLPTDPFARAEVLRWMFFEQNLHEPNISTRRFLLRYGDATAVDPAVLKNWFDRGSQALATMDRHLAGAPWFSAGEYGLADIALYGYTHVAEEGGFRFDGLEHLRDWLARVTEVDGHVPMRD